MGWKFAFLILNESGAFIFPVYAKGVHRKILNTWVYGDSVIAAPTRSLWYEKCNPMCRFRKIWLMNFINGNFRAWGNVARAHFLLFSFCAMIFAKLVGFYARAPRDVFFTPSQCGVGAIFKRALKRGVRRFVLLLVEEMERRTKNPHSCCCESKLLDSALQYTILVEHDTRYSILKIKNTR